MQEKRVKVNGIELQIRDYEHDGDAIVFLHFSGANLMIWQPLLPYFQDHYRLILVDLRGHGKSDKPESGYHMDDMAGDVVGVMQHLGIERAHIVGSSLGSEVGLSMAARYPDKVLSLVCDGAPVSEYGPYSLWEGSEAEYEAHVANFLKEMRDNPEQVFPSAEALVEYRREGLTKYYGWNEAIEAVVRYDVFKIDEGKYTRGFRKYANEAYMAHYFRYNFEDYYKKVQCPLLILLKDSEEPEQLKEKAVVEALLKLTQQRAEIVALREWEHPYGYMLNPEEASKAILTFLEE